MTKIKVILLGNQVCHDGKVLVLVNRLDNYSTVVYDSQTMELVNN